MVSRTCCCRMTARKQPCSRVSARNRHGGSSPPADPLPLPRPQGAPLPRGSVPSKPKLTPQPGRRPACRSPAPLQSHGLPQSRSAVSIHGSRVSFGHPARGSRGPRPPRPFALGPAFAGAPGRAPSCGRSLLTEGGRGIERIRASSSAARSGLTSIRSCSSLGSSSIR